MKLIAIVDKDFGISKNNEIPWSFREDRIFFKKQTLNSSVIMGRKTFLSLKETPLKNRKNILISKTIKSASGFEIFSSLEEAHKKYNDAWIIGGASLYNYALSSFFCNEIFLTIVNASYGADLFLRLPHFNNYSLKIFINKKDYSIIKLYK